ncbi:MAG: hypothetical protein ACOCVB_01785 [Bacillota bacterium]
MTINENGFGGMEDMMREQGISFTEEELETLNKIIEENANQDKNDVFLQFAKTILPMVKKKVEGDNK